MKRTYAELGLKVAGSLKSSSIAAMSDKVSWLDYCRHLLVSQINYTLANFADHTAPRSVNRGDRRAKCLK